MIVHLSENEIHTALIEYIGNQGYPVRDKNVTVTLVAGRKDKKGHSAQLDFETIIENRVAESTDPEPDDANQQAIKFDFQQTDADD